MKPIPSHTGVVLTFAIQTTPEDRPRRHPSAEPQIDRPNTRAASESGLSAFPVALRTRHPPCLGSGFRAPTEFRRSSMRPILFAHQMRHKHGYKSATRSGHTSNLFVRSLWSRKQFGREVAIRTRILNECYLASPSTLLRRLRAQAPLNVGQPSHTGIRVLISHIDRSFLGRRCGRDLWIEIRVTLAGVRPESSTR